MAKREPEERYMIFDNDQKSYISILFIDTPWLWIHRNISKDNAIIYLESELDNVEKVLRKKKINYSLNKIKKNGKSNPDQPTQDPQ